MDELSEALRVADGTLFKEGAAGSRKASVRRRLLQRPDARSCPQAAMISRPLL